jgi:hypothetical protein
MSLESNEGYICALKNMKKTIEEEIERCEYALGECYSNYYEDEPIKKYSDIRGT